MAGNRTASNRHARLNHLRGGGSSSEQDAEGETAYHHVRFHMFLGKGRPAPGLDSLGTCQQPNRLP